MNNSAWSDLLDAILSSTTAAVEVVSKGLPDGGTPDHPNPTRKDDAALIDTLAEQLVLTKTNIGKGDESYQGAYDQVHQLLNAVAQALYAQQVDCIVVALRKWLALPDQEPGHYLDVEHKLIGFFNHVSLQQMLALGDEVVVKIFEWQDFGISQDPDEDSVSPAVAPAAPSLVPDPVTEKIKERAQGLAAEEKADTNTSYGGQAAHAVIQMHYCITHPGHTVLIDRWLIPVPGGFRPGKLPDTGDGLELRTSTLKDGAWLRKALATATDYIKQPDILDLDCRRVYEIKTIGGAIKGARQVYGYLLMLNALLYAGKGGEEAAKRLLAAQNPEQPVPLDFDDPYLPGDWRPAPFYFVPPDMLIAAILAVPGLILYARYTVKLPETKPVAIGLAPALLAACVVGLAAAAAAGVAAGAAVAGLADALTGSVGIPDAAAALSAMLGIQLDQFTTGQL